MTVVLEAISLCCAYSGLGMVIAAAAAFFDTDLPWFDKKVRPAPPGWVMAISTAAGVLTIAFFAQASANLAEKPGADLGPLIELPLALLGVWMGYAAARSFMVKAQQ